MQGVGGGWEKSEYDIELITKTKTSPHIWTGVLILPTADSQFLSLSLNSPNIML